MKMFRRLLVYLKPYWMRIIVSVLAMVVFAFFSSVSVWMVGPMFNLIFNPEEMTVESLVSTDVTPESDGGHSIAEEFKDKLRLYVDSLVIRDTRMGSLFSLCIIILVVFLVKNLAYYFNIYHMAVIEQGIIRDIRNQLFSHIASQSLDFFNKSRVGTLISRLTNDVQVVNLAITNSFMNLIRDPLLALFYLFIVLIISWKLTLVAFATSFGSIYVINKIGWLLRRQSKLAQEKMANITSVIQEAVSGMMVVKAFAMEKFEISKFGSETEHYYDTMKKLMVSRKLSSPITEYLGIISITIVLWYGGKQVIQDGTMQANEFIVYLFALFSLMQPIKSLGQAATRIQEGLAAGQRIFDVLDVEPNVENKENAIVLTGINDGIIFDNVSFDYGEGIILSGINVNINAGEVIALVGPSGAGKSTFASLIPRFYDPSGGKITIDGVDIRDLDIYSLRRLMGYVTQEIILFNDSIRNNIAYGLSKVEMSKIKTAAETANAHEFIKELPEGYDTFVGDRGVRLSGGQKQRIAIARAVLNDPPILIFDEATSSLDTESERQVQRAIENLMRGRTVVVIAHRLSTVQKADRIIVLDGGRIVQEGTHEELIAVEGMYSKLYNMQFP